MIENKCCLCKGTYNSTLYEEVDQYALKKCHCSGLIFLDKYPSHLENFIEDASQEQSATVEFWSVPNLYAKHHKIFDHFFQERLESVTQNGHKLGDVLDIGIGYGFWANYIKDISNSIEGIDIASEAVNYSKSNYKLNANLISFEQYESEKIFDTIFMVDVLEHFPEPIEMLEKAYSMLSKNGKLYIQVPNVIGFKIPYKHGYGLPYHLWQYELNTLKPILAKAGFKVDSYTTGVQGVIGHYEKGGPTLLTKLMWNIAREFKIGNRLQLVASKN